MSIQTQLTALQQDITNARNSVTAQGGTITQSGGSSQLSNDILTIPTQKAVDVSSASEMAEIRLNPANKDKIYRYMGEASSYYTYGCYYVMRIGSYTVENVPGYTYNFIQDSEDMYPSTGITYKSTNYNINNSYSVVKVIFHHCRTVQLRINSWAEGNADFTILSILDAPEVPTSAGDSNTYATSASYNRNPRTSLNNWNSCYFTINDSDDHYVYIVYKKDNTISQNDDIGRFIVAKSIIEVPHFELLNIKYGELTITDLNQNDVTFYSSAQVVDANIAPGNIRKNVNILGVTGTYEGGGGGDPGYKVYFAFGGNGDGAYLQLNGETAEKVTGSYMSGAGYPKCMNSPASGIKTFKTWGYDHPGSSEGSATSFVRYRSHGTNAWTYLSIGRTEADAQLVTLTCDIDLQIVENTCLDRNTLITMADGSKKRVIDVQSGDLVKAYGDKAYTVYKDEYHNTALAEERDRWTFEGGYEIVTAHQHRFYNYEHQEFMYLQEWQIGEHAITEDGSKVALLAHKHENEICNYASLWCNESGIEDKYDEHWKDGNNYYAGGLLSGNRFSKQINID